MSFREQQLTSSDAKEGDEDPLGKQWPGFRHFSWSNGLGGHTGMHMATFPLRYQMYRVYLAGVHELL